jgi:hypothetical protein
MVLPGLRGGEIERGDRRREGGINIAGGRRRKKGKNTLLCESNGIKMYYKSVAS